VVVIDIPLAVGKLPTDRAESTLLLQHRVECVGFNAISGLNPKLSVAAGMSRAPVFCCAHLRAAIRVDSSVPNVCPANQTGIRRTHMNENASALMPPMLVMAIVTPPTAGSGSHLTGREFGRRKMLLTTGTVICAHSKKVYYGMARKATVAPRGCVPFAI
jgi:hypothetical protein